ncbi:hypothetical protein B7494_g5928 [Chlorociboria aeruginascens]|nr:hypothetical protein B7494_g5928 [Chlorociboria aeruginascens]
MSSSPPASRSQASLSPGTSLHRSQNRRDIPLETLVSHLLASKRSLSSISTVWRANEIVTSARSALEESMVLNARTGFLRSGIFEQVKVLEKVRGGIGAVYKDGQRDFKNVLRDLDEANARLESTMDVLRSTMAEAAFRPKSEAPRSLLDFVDEQGVETMRNTLKELIRESRVWPTTFSASFSNISQEAQTDLDSSMLSFDNDLRSLRTALNPSTKNSPSQSQNILPTPIPEHLHELETHAQEMALLLESLSRHFDLCVNAVRHTEGGYAAVRKAASSQPPGAEPVSVSGVMEPEDQTEEVVSEQERREMLTIVENDSAEVEDVVLELRARINEMETKHDSILEYVSCLKTTHTQTNNAYHLLEDVGARLTSYIIASQEFRSRWEEAKQQMHTQMQELEGVCRVYNNYFASYDSLILEVYRRKQMEDKTKHIMRKAMEQIEKVWEADMKEREGFKLDIGEWLPADLYKGVNATPPRWEFVLKEGSAAPALDRHLVEEAMKRDRGRLKRA